MSNYGKMSSAASLPLALLAIAVASPAAIAQDASRTKTPATTPQKPGGAVSSSYARCAQANREGGSEREEASPIRRTEGAPEGECTSPTDAAQADAVARDNRTYTGGRRNENATSAAEAAPGQPIKGVIVKGGGPNKPAQAGQVPATDTAKSIREKGVSSTKSR